MKLIRASALMGLIAAAAIAGCSSSSPNTPSSHAGSTGAGTPSDSTGESGSVSMQLQIGPGVSISTVSYVITNPTLAGFTTITGSVDVSGSQTIGFSVTLPVANGYTLSLSAVDSNGDGCSGGPVSFNVMAAQSNSVALTLVCSQTVDGGLEAPDVNVGTVVVSADASLQTTTNVTPCAAATSLVATPNETGVGHSITLTATGIDPNNQSSDVTLTWAATGGAGSLGSTSGGSNTFSCTGAGTETVTVTAAISNGGASCPNTGSLSVTLTCSMAGDAAVDTGAPDTSAPDTSVADTSVPDTSVADTSTPDVTEASGPPVPCTSAGQANCVQCDGNSTGVCTQTEQAILAKDIAAGLFSGNVPTSAACYECLFNAGCIDDTVFGDTGNECDDMSGNFQDSGQPDKTLCLNTLNCTLNTGCAGPAGVAGEAGASSADVTVCYCGGNFTGTACNSAGAAVDGQCLASEVAGLGFPASDNTDILKNYSSKTLPSGKANAIFSCAKSHNCSNCALGQ